ncbi:hypothetical protein F5972_01790 [Microbispora cellulosiformans]|uniref:Uncharacterized protein n=1 Tax=Microbispora cellulosiformans TaxID=2614688 RepID=A0A5J5K9C9_9ACTN|nr:hypothetical protein [Microbispora cellulosiformans]KAA9381590.1 hypothetical protein F5972_01790 [Microbispora cellulosiformans]
MTGGLLHAPLAGDGGSEILDHLLSDVLIKGGIVVFALLALVLGMVLIWRKIGKGDVPEHDR